MFLDRRLYQYVLEHSLDAVAKTPAETEPFPHISIADVFPQDVYQQLTQAFPAEDQLLAANPKHHTNEYGGSTRRRMVLSEASLNFLSPTDHKLWATVRAAICSTAFRDAIFAKVSSGLCRRFRTTGDRLSQIAAYPRGILFSESDGYRIAPHPDTTEKIVTMQFAFPDDESLAEIGTEFYQRSVNPMHLMREPRGFVVAKTMPFLPNRAYAFSVLNTVGLKSWHGRCTIRPVDGLRKSLLHIWYTEPDQTHGDLEAYQQFLGTSRAAA